MTQPTGQTATAAITPYIEDNGEVWLSIEIEGLTDPMYIPLPDARRFANTILNSVNQAEQILKERQAHE